MTVTDIKEYNKTKYEIYVDSEFACVLYKGELHKYGIRKEGNISDAAYNELMEQVLPKRAKLRAMNLLTKRPYTEMKLREKLTEGMYPPVCIETAIAYVKSFGYLDDKMYATDYISYHIELQSAGSIEQKLMQKGIDKRLIRECMNELNSDRISENEREQIRRIFRKKYKGVVPREQGEKAKMLQYFVRKGYSMSNIKLALEENSLDDLYN